MQDPLSAAPPGNSRGPVALPGAQPNGRREIPAGGAVTGSRGGASPTVFGSGSGRSTVDVTSRPEGFTMTARITRDIIESYLSCKYKAYLKVAGKQGTASEYEALIGEARN